MAYNLVFQPVRIIHGCQQRQMHYTKSAQYITLLCRVLFAKCDGGSKKTAMKDKNIYDLLEKNIHYGVVITRWIFSKVLGKDTP